MPVARCTEQGRRKVWGRWYWLPPFFGRLHILNPTPTPIPDYVHQIILSPPRFLNFRHPCTLLSQSAQCPKPFLRKWMASQMVSERNFFKVTELLSTALEKQWVTEVHFVSRRFQKLEQNHKVTFLIKVS